MPVWVWRCDKVKNKLKMKHKLGIFYSFLVRTFLFFLPDAPVIMRFRGWLYSLFMRQCGKNFQVAHSAVLNGLDDLIVGDNVYIANFCSFISNGLIIIENDVLFGPSVVVSAGNHQFNGHDYKSLSSEKQDVRIGSGSWIAANVSIVGGAIIPQQSVVAANSCVTRSLEQGEHCLYGGVPARKIKQL